MEPSARGALRSLEGCEGKLSTHHDGFEGVVFTPTRGGRRRLGVSHLLVDYCGNVGEWGDLRRARKLKNPHRRVNRASAGIAALLVGRDGLVDSMEFHTTWELNESGQTVE